jgi:large subunit ribosomal protein L23
LLVAYGENRNLELASRNLEGVKLSAPNALQPYEVLKHDRLVLSKDAVARLVHSLDPEAKPVEVPDVESIAAAPAKKEAAAKKPAAKKAAKPTAKKGKSTPHYQIIRRPIITEKGLGVKEVQGTVVFEVSAKATKTQIKEAVQQIFKVKVAGVRTANFYGKMRRRGQTEGYRRDWKKAYVKLAAGEKMIEFAENL